MHGPARRALKQQAQLPSLSFSSPLKFLSTMDANRLPPVPTGHTKKEAAKAKKLQRKAVNLALPQSDDADLIVQVSEQVLGLRIEEPVSTFVWPSAVDATQTAIVKAISSALFPTQENGKRGEVSAGHEPVATELSMEMVLGSPAGLSGPFQDDSLSLLERVSDFNRFVGQARATAKEWEEIVGEKPACMGCGRKHPPPCMTSAQREAQRAALKEGRRLRAEFNSAKNGPPTLPHAEMLETIGPNGSKETVMAKSRFGLTESKRRSTLCRVCAKWHPGGAEECTTPFCPRGCGLNHPPWEACGAAVKRFKQVKLSKGVDGEGEVEEKKKPMPAPSQATATGDIARFGVFFNSLGDDPDVLQAAGGLFASMARKRPAAESAEKAGSKNKKKKGKKT